MAVFWNTGNKTIESVIDRAMTIWANESRFANQTNMDQVPNYKVGDGIGHFTAMVTDRSIKMGCAIMYSFNPTGATVWNQWLIACDYAATNMVGWPTYVSGKTASKCTKGTDKTYKGLCSEDEPIDPNVNPLKVI